MFGLISSALFVIQSVFERACSQAVISQCGVAIYDSLRENTSMTDVHLTSKLLTK